MGGGCSFTSIDVTDNANIITQSYYSLRSIRPLIVCFENCRISFEQINFKDGVAWLRQDTDVYPFIGVDTEAFSLYSYQCIRCTGTFDATPVETWLDRHYMPTSNAYGKNREMVLSKMQDQRYSP